MAHEKKKLKTKFKVTLALGAPLLFFLLLEIVLLSCGFGHSMTFMVRQNFNGEDYHVPNPWFTAPYFPKQNPRQTSPFAIPVNKPENTIRVLVLGASVAQGDPKHAFGFHRMLERSLAKQFPGKQVAIHNLGITAINSHVVKEIARDCRDLEADHWIIYLGNNEVAGPFGPANPSIPLASYGAIRKTRLALSKTRTGQLLQNILLGNPLEGKSQLKWVGMEGFLQPVQWNSEELKAVYENFRSNLENIVDSAKQSGANVLLCTVAVNLRTCAPLNPSGPAIKFWEAKDYGKARDLDSFRFRADSRINSIIKEVADTKEVILVDAASTFESLESDTNETVFHEHVHFTFKGNLILTQLLAKALGVEEIPSDMEALMAYTSFDRQAVLKMIRGRLLRPPFLNQGSNGLSAHQLDDQIKALEPSGPEDLEATDRAYLAAIASYPEDAVLRLNFANFLLSFNRADLAMEHCRKALSLAPWNPNTHYNLALCLAGAGRLASVRKHLEEALELQPFDHLSRSLFGNFLADSKPEEAIRQLKISLAIEPKDKRSLLTLAKIYLSTEEKNLRNSNEAFELAMRACVVTNFANPAAVGMLVEAAQKSGKQKEATAAIREAMETKGDVLRGKLEGALKAL